MGDLRERLAALQNEMEMIFVAVQEREWPGGKTRRVIDMLKVDLDDLLLNLNHLIILDEAWTKEE